MTYSPEAPGGLRLSAQGPAAGEQADRQAWFLGMQLLGSQTPPHSPGPASSLSQNQLLFSLCPNHPESPPLMAPSTSRIAICSLPPLEHQPFILVPT